MISINMPRLQQRIEALGQIGATPRGGVARLAFSAADKAGRDQVCAWMQAAGLDIVIDRIGNIFGTRVGSIPDASPVMTGSHIDSVRDGGKLDGCLGVLAGIEFVETLNDHNILTERPVCIAVFSNEEGVRFQPDMMGSLVHAGGYALTDALATQDRDGIRLADALQDCGYAGSLEPGAIRPHRFIELHIEQGPVLEAENIQIGAVGDLQGISWTQVQLSGQSNHAGTTPMHLRRDAALGAARIIAGIREIAREIGTSQVATCGELNLKPNLINVIAREAVFSVDLRNTNDAALNAAEARLDALIAQVCEEEGLDSSARRLARFEPVGFDAEIVERIESSARDRGLSCKRMTSGAGHDAQMLARICPSAMIFTPSIGGISHNPAEATSPVHIEAGANVLLDVMLALTAH